MNTYIIDYNYIFYIFCLFIVLLRLNIQYMSKMDKDIFYYLLMNNDNTLLQKYRDYFPSCNKIPIECDTYIFMIVYILYIPIVCCIILVKHIKNLCNDILLYIKHPLLLSKGMAYNAILPYITQNSRLTPATFNKIYWNKLFRNLNIKTPTIIGTIKNGTVKYKKGYTITDSSKYIIKDVYGCCGNSVKIFDDKNIPSSGYYIIQDYIKLKDNITYRIITNSIDKNINILDIYSLQNNAVVTNISQGGKLQRISIEDNPILKYAGLQCINAHKEVNDTHNCNTIGWDIIVKDEIAYFLEGNIGVSVDNDNYIKFVEHFYKNNV